MPLLAIGCSQVETEDILNTNNTILKTKDGEITKLKQRCTIHIEDIRSYEALTNNEKETKIISEITPIICDQDTVLYVVNYDNNKGWTLYPSDKRAPAILASSKTGNYFDQNNDPGKDWTNFTVENIYALKNSSQCDTLTADFEMWNNIQKPILKKQTTKDYPEAFGEWKLISVEKEFHISKKIGPLTKTSWHQTSPWNSCVPNTKAPDGKRCVAGCVAISGAQCIYALHETLGIPKYFYATGNCYGWSAGSSYNFRFAFDDVTEEWWSKMARDQYESEERCKHAAVLIGYVGREAGIKWNENSSGTDTKKLVGVFKELGIYSEFSSYDVKKILSTLNSNCPVIIRGKTDRNKHKILGITVYTTYEGGHSWLIDGYEKQTYEYTYYYQWILDESIDITSNAIHSTRYTEGTPDPYDTDPVPTVTHKTSSYSSSTEYITMNWGHGGYVHQKYSFNNYNQEINFDGYKYNLDIITGFKPLENN